MKSSTYGRGLRYFVSFLLFFIRQQKWKTLANCLRRFIKAPLLNGFVTLAWNARVGYSADKTVTHLCYKDIGKEEYFTPCKKFSYVVPRCVGLSLMGEGTVKGLRTGTPRYCGEQWNRQCIFDQNILSFFVSTARKMANVGGSDGCCG